MADTKIVEIQLVNEYGSGYGVKAYVFANTPDDAMDALLAEYGEEEVYGDHDIWSQFHFEFVTKFDSQGNASREHGAWLALLSQFNSKELGHKDLRQVVRILGWEGWDY